MEHSSQVVALLNIPLTFQFAGKDTKKKDSENGREKDLHLCVCVCVSVRQFLHTTIKAWPMFAHKQQCKYFRREVSIGNLWLGLMIIVKNINTSV